MGWNILVVLPLLLLHGAAEEVALLHGGRCRTDLRYGARGGGGRGSTLLPLRTSTTTMRRRHTGRDVVGVPIPGT